ncbi:OLC1v1030523C1 [Oldenlandia corymbosa var. corymbosa]|uniref:OLC1v1030523C1 n=1 Tax=Oldenlandia corymbosa var. corymbosa TaxID=529605 RepID=A0AAV1CG69_OLDCO|nr:OLC1v1030523C1 [Oldenlandia corymbosa var. corymbosa]
MFTYEYVPSFCSKCKKIGHKEEECRKGKAFPPAQVVKNPSQEKQPQKDVKGQGILIKKSAKWNSKPSTTVATVEPKSVQIEGDSYSSRLTLEEKSLIPVDVTNDSSPSTDVPQKILALRLMCKTRVMFRSVNNKFQPLAEIVTVEEANHTEDESEESKQPDEEATNAVNEQSAKQNLLARSLIQCSGRVVHYASDEEPGTKTGGLFEEEEVEGGGVKNKVAELRLRSLIQTHSVSSLIILEPMLEVDQLDDFRRILRFDHAFSSSSSKIWVFCKNGFVLSLLADKGQVLHFEAKHPLVDGSFYVSAVYAKSSRRERQQLWAGLKAFNDDHAGRKWMVVSDFNAIRCLDEYSGTVIQNRGTMDDFNGCISDCNLSEIQAFGEEFTWGGSRQNG